MLGLVARRQIIIWTIQGIILALVQAHSLSVPQDSAARMLLFHPSPVIRAQSLLQVLPLAQTVPQELPRPSKPRPAHPAYLEHTLLQVVCVNKLPRVTGRQALQAVIFPICSDISQGLGQALKQSVLRDTAVRTPHSHHKYVVQVITLQRGLPHVVRVLQALTLRLVLGTVRNVQETPILLGP